MATPVAHSLLAIAVVQGVRPGFSPRLWPRLWPWWLLAVFLACAPDLDFLPGMLIGDANRFHQGPSHSLAAAAMAGTLVFMVARWLGGPALRLAILGFLSYASHLLLDVFTEDRRAPLGIPLFWPFSSEAYQAPWPLFGGVKHGVPGDSLSTVLGHVFSLANAATVAVEAVLLAPVLLASWLISRRLVRGGQLKG